MEMKVERMNIMKSMMRVMMNMNRNSSISRMRLGLMSLSRRRLLKPYLLVLELIMFSLERNRLRKSRNRRRKSHRSRDRCLESRLIVSSLG